ncbi:hypothetical protein RVR_3913 [Actinacidiphila reveromycinica]|uniref:SAF domain-containing protein n=1 Tax=Actinacidiphila reveromycinica TaxID=659352 RepID=A0A7U3USG8_9ACTN|nr:hypothetical protein RVR_3913 [Streptomyces sp. SN-593]
MKTRERSAAGGGNGRQSVPAPNANGPAVGSRLPVAPRERKPALAALAVLLILVGALGATVMVLRAGNKVSVVEITADVAVGDKIPVSAMREVMVADGTDVKYIRWNQREDLATRWRAATNLTSGSVLVSSMITEKSDVLAPGKTLVGLSLKKGQFPSGLADGLTVAAYLVGNDVKSSTDSSATAGGTGGGSSPISDDLVIKDIDTGSNSSFGDGTETITVIADADDAGALATASAAGDVSLVLVPSKN